MLRGRVGRPLCRRPLQLCDLAVERGAVAGPLVGGGPVAGHLLRGRSLEREHAKRKDRDADSYSEALRHLILLSGGQTRVRPL